jgi:hypothetical protein
MRHRLNVLAAVATLGLGLTLSSVSAAARNVEALGEPVTAIWREHRIAFDYHSFNVRYSCSGLQKKLGSILKAVGAHDDLEVEINCAPDSFISSANMLVTLKLPVAASEANVLAATTYTTQQELVARLQRVQLPTANDLQRFNAEWRTISLTRNRRLRLDSGDCDLLTGVREQLLPKLGITTQDFVCYGNGTRTRPKIQVAALVPVEPPAVAVTADSRAAIATVD